MAQRAKVIVVVGGGPAGLTAAHALHLAGIDFVVLERRDTMINDVGASLVLNPQSLRVMSQLGLLDSLKSAGAELYQTKSIDREGYLFRDTRNIDLLEKYFGMRPLIFHRAELVRIIYEGLPEDAKQKVLKGKKVVDISTDDDGVTVACEDGSIYEGSVVIGADGVYSKTRQMMRKIVLDSDPKAQWDEERPFTSTYRCLWCSFPRPPSYAEGINLDTQHKDRSVMFLTGKEKGWIFLYEKLPEPTAERTNYTESDIDDFAEVFKDWPISEDLKVKDVYNRESAGMSNLDEGILEHWHHERIVLVGDACHKFTPNAGLGLNSGIQDVTSVCNRLQTLISQDPNGDLKVDALDTTFGEYRVERIERLKAEYSRSAAVTRMHAWANGIYYLFARYILATSFCEALLLMFMAPKNMRQGLVLDYVHGKEPFSGTVSWTHAIPPLGKMEE